MALITKKEAAARLAVGEKTLEWLIGSGELPAYRIARSCIRLEEADIDAYIARCRIKAQAAAEQKRRTRKPTRRTCAYRPGDKVV